MTKTSEAIIHRPVPGIFRFIQLLTPVDLSQIEQQKTEIILQCTNEEMYQENTCVLIT